MRCYDEGEKAMWQTRFNGPDKHGTKTEAVTIIFTKNIIVNEYQYIIYLNRIFSILLVAQQT